MSLHRYITSHFKKEFDCIETTSLESFEKLVERNIKFIPANFNEIKPYFQIGYADNSYTDGVYFKATSLKYDRVLLELVDDSRSDDAFHYYIICYDSDVSLKNLLEFFLILNPRLYPY